jgi:hypothetical protein
VYAAKQLSGFESSDAPSVFFPRKWIPGFLIQNFRFAIENRFQWKIWIEMTGSQPIAIEKR